MSFAHEDNPFGMASNIDDENGGLPESRREKRNATKNYNPNSFKEASS